MSESLADVIARQRGRCVCPREDITLPWCVVHGEKCRDDAIVLADALEAAMGALREVIDWGCTCDKPYGESEGCPMEGAHALLAGPDGS